MNRGSSMQNRLIDPVILTFDLLTPKAHHFEYIPRSFPVPSSNTLESLVSDWLTDFAQVDNTETKLDWKLQCAGQQGVKLTNSWPRDKYKLKLLIKQYKLKIYKLQITEQ